MRIVKLLPLLALCAGCTAESPDWESLVAATPPPAAALTPSPDAQPPPVVYRSAQLRSPFAPETRHAARPTAHEPKGPLAAVPLDQVRLVGTLAGRGARFALVQGPGDEVHRLTVGDALGSDGGRIDAVQESSVRLVEVVRDGAGGWRRRVQTLALPTAGERAAEPEGAAT